MSIKQILFTAVAFEIPSNVPIVPQEAFERGFEKGGVAMSEIPVRQVALIGFGEVGGIFGRDLAAAGIGVAAFDILFNSGQLRTAMLAKAKIANVRACNSMNEAIRGADLVISAVTSSAAVGAAKEAAS